MKNTINKKICSSLILLGIITQAHALHKILIIRKETKEYELVASELMIQMKKKYEFIEKTVDNSATVEDFKKYVEGNKSELVIVMDNKSVNLAKEYNEKNPGKEVKAVALMALNLRQSLEGNKFIAGVAFEPPAYSLVTNFRFVSKKPIKNILTVYRKSIFEKMVKDTTALLKNEKITLTAFDAESTGKESEKVNAFVKTNFAAEVKSGKYDAVWVLLDNVLILPTFVDVWKPLSKEVKIPFITGLEKFVSPDMDFATFGISPDLKDLAGQARQMIETIVEDGEEPSKIGVEELIGVNKVINIKKAKENESQIDEEKLNGVKTLD